MTLPEIGEVARVFLHGVRIPGGIIRSFLRKKIIMDDSRGEMVKDIPRNIELRI